MLDRFGQQEPCTDADAARADQPQEISAVHFRHCHASPYL
jgi:hypothetical protein